MPAHATYSGAPNRQSPKTASPVKTLQQDAFRGPASPSRGSVDWNNRREVQEREATPDETYARGTYMEKVAPLTAARNHDEAEDPHDLSFSPKHVPHASMVDNMVRSLDRFSNGVEPSSYNEVSELGSRYNIMGFSRQRGHNATLSVSSEGDAFEDQASPRWSTHTPTASATPRNINARVHRQKLPSIFGEDDDSTRVKVYDSQRATRPPKSVGKKHKQKGSKGSASSSVDLGHLAQFHGRLGPAGNRRSRSFDFGSNRPKDLSIVAPDPLEVAAPPVVFAGPEAQSSPVKENFPYPLGRRNSTKSSKSAYAKKSTIRAIGNDQMPALPTMRSSPALSSVLSEHKNSGNTTEAAQSPRPGFFRRMFSSSSNFTVPGSVPTHFGTSRPSHQGRDTPVLDEEAGPSTNPSKLQKAMRTDSTDTSAGKENQNTLAKKSSAFFRRRKKSISSNAPPPLPLTLNRNLKSEAVKAGEPSPVSSLRALMGPYLAEKDSNILGDIRMSEDGPAYYSAHSTPQLEADVAFREESKRRPGHDRQISAERPKLQIPDRKQGTLLLVPHQDSFLADSSSVEEPSKKSLGTSSPSDKPRAGSFNRSPTESVHRVPSNQSSIANASMDRPVLPPRQDSWRSDISTVPSPRPSAAAPLPTSFRPRLDLTTPEDRLKVTASTVSPIRSRVSPRATSDEASEYQSAPSTPLSADQNDKADVRSPVVHVSHPSVSIAHTSEEKAKAQLIYDNEDEAVEPGNASAWLAEAGSDRERIRKAYMELFNWTGFDILAAMRGLCDRIALKGETQQVDRMLDAFASRWCECNTNHGFKSSDVVHTICYSILLLNTDLHLADIGQKMTRTQFIRNALPTIIRVGRDLSVNDTIRATSPSTRSPLPDALNTPRRDSMDQDASPAQVLGRPLDRLTRDDSAEFEPSAILSGPLVDAPFVGPERGWEVQIEIVLKSFYASISRERLPLFGAPAEISGPPTTSSNLLSMTGNMLRRTPSTLSKAQSDTVRGRLTGESRTLGSRFTSKGRVRSKLTPGTGFGSSRTSLDEQSSSWSPSMSSTWSKASLGKTLTSASVDSFGSEATKPDYQSSIGFANALSQAIIREDQLEFPIDDGLKAVPLLEDDSLALCGAPWAKEGIVKHKCHLEGVDKKSKDRNWNHCFAVIENGWMRLFSFSMNAKSMRLKAKNQKAGGVVGGGNWQDNAEEVWKFMLRHTIASSLPPPGYSKARPYVWALSLPTGAVHLFSVGTPDIVKEFVSTANYWSARLSKEPMMGGISNMEYGWSDSVINRALIGSDLQPVLNCASPTPRPSTQMSMRSSIDHGTGSIRPKLPGDKLYINEWIPPQQSMMASQLMEIDQLKGLQTYVKAVEVDLQKHNELRAPMLLAFTTRHPNSSKAMGNWEKKSSYLLREIVKFRTYIDNLESAQASKEKIYVMRREHEENRQQEDDLRALGAGMNATATV